MENDHDLPQNTKHADVRLHQTDPGTGRPHHPPARLLRPVGGHFPKCACHEKNLSAIHAQRVWLSEGIMRLPEELQYIENSLKKQHTTAARMDGKICVITGATSGVGYQAAKRLAEGGAHIVMVCRNREKAQKVQAELVHAYGSRVDIVIADFQKLARSAAPQPRSRARTPKFMCSSTTRAFLTNAAG